MDYVKENNTITITSDVVTINAIEKLLTEYKRAVKQHGMAFHSMHEAHAILREEFEEAWDEIKINCPEKACDEMAQVGAVAIKFLLNFHRLH